MAIMIRPMTEHDAVVLRDMRLRALTDSPPAFGSLLRGSRP